MKFFGHEVSDTGCEMLIKVGSRFADPGNDGHLVSWRDGQIIEIAPLGFHNGKQVGYCCTLLKFPNIDYTTLGGRWEEDWKKMPAKATLWDKINHGINEDGKYPWEVIEGTEFERKRKTRDYFIDFKDLENKHLITKSERENIYNFDHKTIIDIPQSSNIVPILKHEEVDARLDSSKLLQHASITSGTHSIGSGLDYATVTAFEAAIGAQLTGNLTGEHNDEETAISTKVTFDTDTNSHLLKLTAQSGDEHSGGAYGNGARINYAGFDALVFDETSAGDLDDVEISKLALDISGSSNEGVWATDLADTGNFLINRLLIKGDSDSVHGVFLDQASINITVINTIIYGIGNGGADGGIVFDANFGGSNVFYVCNNTCIGNYNNFRQDDGSQAATLTFKNNLAQADLGGDDYSDAGAGWGTHAKNISEDATSPDAAYQSKDVHTNSVFKGYATDDYRLDSAGDATNLAIVDDGDNLYGSGVTEDIEGIARDNGTPFWIGASHIVAAGGQSIVPIVMQQINQFCDGGM